MWQIFMSIGCIVSKVDGGSSSVPVTIFLFELGSRTTGKRGGDREHMPPPPIF